MSVQFNEDLNTNHNFSRFMIAYRLGVFKAKKCILMSFLIFFYDLLSYNGDNGTPATDTAWPAALI